MKGSIHGFKFHDVDLDGEYNPDVDEPFHGIVFDLFDSAGNSFRQIDTGFEDGAFPGNFTTFSTDPDGTPDPDDLWRIDVDPVGGGLVARSGDLNSLETSTLEATVDGWGVIAFDKLVSLEDGFDFFNFKIDGNLVDSWTGVEAAFTSEWYRVEGDGPHTLSWEVTKDETVADGLDAGFLDNVIFWTTSDENGEFWYTDLIPGDYTVVEYPDAYTQYPGEVMSTTHEPDDRFPWGAVSAEVRVWSRQELVWRVDAAHLPPDSLREEVLVDNLDFGNFVKGSIHGFKFEDWNADGVFDPGSDNGWEGFEFTLYHDENGNGVIDDEDVVASDAVLSDGVEISNESGEFWFEGLFPGDYILVESGEPGGDPLGEIMPSTSTQRSVVVGSGEELVWRDGAAMLDSDGDGQNDPDVPWVKHEVLDRRAGWRGTERLQRKPHVRQLCQGFDPRLQVRGFGRRWRL